jgi:meiosis induction protein kinase IME2/SME1
MTVAYDLTHRGSSSPQVGSGQALEDRFEVLKDIGDGSFGSVVLARVRGAGASVARRGTIVRTGNLVYQLFNAD